jgi:hypothetical protein
MKAGKGIGELKRRSAEKEVWGLETTKGRL